MNIVILLTGCINPNGMSFTKLQDKKERLSQYEKAISWYICNTDLKVIFVDNSMSDLSYLKEKLGSDRLEILSFNGNNYDKALGKGYGEGKIIEYALSHSIFLKNNPVIIKITGRLIFINILEILNLYASYNNNKTILCDFNRDLSVAFSRVFIAPLVFYKDYLLMEVKKCNDTAKYEFEHALASAIRRSLSEKECVLKIFSKQYLLSGISGTDGTPIKNKSFLKIKLKELLFNCGIWGNYKSKFFR